MVFCYLHRTTHLVRHLELKVMKLNFPENGAMVKVGKFSERICI